MAMERFCISMSEKDVDNFERGRTQAGMTKSAYVRLLIAEHENKEPGFIKYRQIIEQISETNQYLKELVLKPDLKDEDILRIYEIQKSIERLIREKI